jgi:hypothetical protein
MVEAEAGLFRAMGDRSVPNEICETIGRPTKSGYTSTNRSVR